MIEKFIIPKLDEKELHSKLSDVRYPNEFEDDSVGWKCGAPTWAVQDMVHEWKNNYSWEKAREKMNRWNNYRTPIDDLNIHFVHETSSSEKAIPIILLHGWPSTFYEFHKIIEPLRDNTIQAFHVVVPSLPGYGFSDPPKRDGCGVPQISDIMDKLMVKLGYDKYMIYGTDWGASIGTHMSQSHSDRVIGFLTNMPSAYPPVPSIRNLLFHPIKVLLFILSIFVGFDTVYGENETKGIAELAFANVDKCESAGYRAIQSTRPYTLAYGLSDSPVGLLGWMLDPYHAWTDLPTATADKLAIPETITKDEFLTQVTIYWITNTMSSSYRLYYEAKKDNLKALTIIGKTVVKVPMAVSYFRNEAIKFPRDWLEVSGNLVQFKSYSKGGHFPSLEVTDLILSDLQQFGLKISNKQTQQKKKVL